MKNTKIISVFPACGKTYCFNNYKDIKVLDSDSSKFSWNGKYRNPDFPNNYIEYIKENLGYYDYIFVSSHEIVRKALRENGLEYSLVFPRIECKEEWIGRCWLRGSSEEFIENLAKHWYDWIEGLAKEYADYGIETYRLGYGEYLSDYYLSY